MTAEGANVVIADVNVEFLAVSGLSASAADGADDVGDRMGVSIEPGTILLTRMLRSLNSAATAIIAPRGGARNG
ncbi:hypothetical protein [Streptomyces sp. NPDC001076]